MVSAALEMLPSLTEPPRFREILLRRLRRVLLLRFYAGSLLSGSDRRLLDRAIFSTFCDCEALGIGVEARRLLNDARAGIGLFGRPPCGVGGAERWFI